jgi:hypothetical protein
MRKERKAKMRKKERMGLGKAFLSRSILIYLLEFMRVVRK